PACPYTTLFRSRAPDHHAVGQLGQREQRGAVRCERGTEPDRECRESRAGEPSAPGVVLSLGATGVVPDALGYAAVAADRPGRDGRQCGELCDRGPCVQDTGAALLREYGCGSRLSFEQP